MSKQAAYTVLKSCVALFAICLGLMFGAVYLVDQMYPTNFEVTAMNYNELRKTKLFQSVWLPDTMPESMRDLNVSVDLDVIHVDATFFIAPADVDELIKGFEPTTVSASGIQKFSRERNARAEWLHIDPQTGRVEWTIRHTSEMNTAR
jgi:hypothetical protein